MDFLFKSADFALKIDEFCITNDAGWFKRLAREVSKNDEFCIKNEYFCIQN